MSKEIDSVKQVLIKIMSHDKFPFDHGGCDIDFRNELVRGTANAFIRCDGLEFWVFHGMNSLTVAIKIDGKIPEMDYRSYEGDSEYPLTADDVAEFIIRSIIEGPEKVCGVEEIPLSDVEPRWGFN